MLGGPEPSSLRCAMSYLPYLLLEAQSPCCQLAQIPACSLLDFGQCVIGCNICLGNFLGGHFPLGISSENVLLWRCAGPAPVLGHFQAFS